MAKREKNIYFTSDWHLGHDKEFWDNWIAHTYKDYIE